MPKAQREKAIGRVKKDVEDGFGARLVCLALYGSGAGKSFDPGASDLNFAVVLDAVGVEDLRRFHDWLPAWHRLGAASPLLIDMEFLQRARDVFPIELEDIRTTHRLLAGEDVFTGLEVAPVDLRRELEQEARAKLLRLRVAYAETRGRRKDIETLMIESVKSFAVIMRGVLRLQGAVVSDGVEAAVSEFGRSCGAGFPAMLQAARVRGGAPWDGVIEDHFARYLAEVERLVQRVDELYDSTAKGADGGDP